MRKFFLAVLVILLCQFIYADFNCVEDENCEEGHLCIRFNDNDYYGICILESDLFDGRDNVFEVVWPENDNSSVKKINFFIIKDYEKDYVITRARENTDEDLSFLEQKSELEFFDILVARYIAVFNLRPWNLYSGMFRFIKVNINNCEGYGLLSESEFKSVYDELYPHIIYLNGGNTGGSSINNTNNVSAIIATPENYMHEPYVNDLINIKLSAYYLYKPEKLLSHEIGHDIAFLNESYGTKKNYEYINIESKESNIWCLGSLNDAQYIAENANVQTIDNNFSCIGYGPDCLYDTEGIIKIFLEDSSYIRTTSDVVRDLCYDCDINGINCTPKNTDFEGNCLVFDNNGDCIEYVKQPVCENLFSLKSYGHNLLNNKWVKWMVWAKSHQNEYPLEYLPSFFRIREFYDTPETYCFRPSFFTAMDHSFSGFNHNLIDESQIRYYTLTEYVEKLNGSYIPYPNISLGEYNYKLGLWEERKNPYLSSGYFGEGAVTGTLQDIAFDSNGEAEFRMFNGISEQALSGFNSLVKKGTELRVEWQVCWITENPITMPIKAKKRSEICHIVEKRGCEEDDIYGCMKPFKFHKKDFIRPATLSERNLRDINKNYVTVKAVIKDFGDYKESYNDDGLSMYYRTRYIDQTCETPVPFKEYNETVYPGEVSYTYLWNIKTTGLQASDLNCNSSYCGSFDRTDSDGDLVPDKCDIYPNCAGTNDSDGDGIADGCDNCPYVPNPVEIFEGNPFTDLAYGAKKIHNGYWQPYGNLQDSYFWQPDRDLDGIGDACDLKTDPAAKGYSTSYSWRHFGKIGSSWQGELFDYFEMNSTIGIHVGGGYYGSEIPSPFSNLHLQNGGQHRVHYCGLDLSEYCLEINGDKTGCESSINTWSAKCQTVTENGKEFGRSHATTNILSANGRERWPHVAWAESSAKAKGISYSEVNDHKNAIPTASVFWPHPVAYWNWKADIYAQYNCSNPQSIGVYAICENTSGSIRENTPVYYDLSSNYAGNSNAYLLSSNSSVNPDYFKNYSTRSDNSDYDQFGKWAMATRLNRDPMTVKYKKSELLTPDELKDSYKSFISQILWADEAPNILFSPYSLILDELDFVKYQTVGFLNSGSVSYSITESSIPVLSHMRQIISGDIPGVTYSIAKNFDDDDVYSFFVNYAPSNDWHKMGAISNYSDYDLEWSSAAVYNKTIYIAGIEDAQSTIVKNLYRIVRNGDDFAIEPVMTLPVDGSRIRLISALDKLYVISDNNGMFSTLAVNPETEKATLINSEITPLFIRPLNVIGTETGIYIAGKYDPADQNNTIIAKLIDNNGWQIIHSGISADTDKLIMDVIDNKIIMTNIIADSDMTTRIELNLNNDNINIASIETFDVYGFEENPGSYCIDETDSVLKGGFQYSDSCVPFTHPWYKQFSTGSTVYSVAGKGDRLYVGTSNSIKVFDISDPNALTLKYTFATNSRIVYDLEIADGDIMYAATSKGLYKLSTANPDTLSVIGSFYSTGSYNYQYKIQLYNDKLYVGDDNGINIRNKDTFARLAYVNIGSVLDFAIANGEIAMYWSAFWDEGIQIRGVDALNMKAYDYATCYTGELATDHGAFYLSCDDYEYRFAGLPNTYLDYFPVDGDIREMQENYAYNGWAYISDGSYVKLSTSNDVPAVCGNGVTEPGELCDGNSVECTTLDPDYTGGSAACNSTCNGYNEVNCETDGW